MAPRSDQLPVAEIFGPTIQGEGPSSGRPAAFVRLSGCNLWCRGCDTPYTWRFTDAHPHVDDVVFDPARERTWMTVAAVLDAVRPMGTDRVVITGGEPLLQVATLVPLIEALLGEGRAVEVETNGTVAPPPALHGRVQYNVSPKVGRFAEGMPADRCIRADVLRAFVAEDSVLKFVVEEPADVDAAAEVVALAGMPDDRVWAMPAGRSPAEWAGAARAVVDDVIARGWRLTPRLHVFIWGDERGR